MSFWMRAVAATMLAVMTLTSLPIAAGAVSTQSEIRQGQDEIKHIDAQNGIVNDPVLNNWVNSIADNLRRERARPDINYTFKIIDTDDINAFSLPGGFIYLNFGLLNFVNSDDELAGVMGHEMGHVERRHVVTLPAKAQALNLIIGILSIFSPFLYRFGGLIGSAALYKISRADELQADQYGLMLMTRAGYDPDAMVTFMQRLEAEYGAHGSIIDKYFEDHPDSGARVSHLLGYPQLNSPDAQQTLAQAIHDQDEGRYGYALGKFQTVLKAEPTNELAMLHVGEVDLALGSIDESHSVLTQLANAHTNDTGSAAAQHELAMLPRDPPSNQPTPTLVSSLRTSLANTQATAHNNATALDERIKLQRHDTDQFSAKIDALAYEVPDLSQVNVRPGSRLEGVIFDLEHMSKDLNLIISKSQFIALNGLGMSKDIVGTLNLMEAPLREKNLNPQAQIELPYYPVLINQLNTSTNDLLSSVNASRGAVALGWQAAPMLDTYFRKLSRASLDFGGDLSPNTAAELKPLAAAALVQLDKAADAMEKAHSLYFAAQSRQVQAQITMLGVNFPEARYTSLAKAIHARLGIDAPTYAESHNLGMAPGDVAVASWLAAEERVPVTTVINEQRQANKPFIDLALSKSFAPESLEVTLGLWFEGYAEKPAPARLAPLTPATPAATAQTPPKT
jgi:Zn-dependent protease with chaperone function